MYIMAGRNVPYQQGVEAAGALDSIDMPERAKIVRDTAEKMLGARNELDALIAETS